MKIQRSAIWTIPNLLTLIRILAVPVVVYWLYKAPLEHAYFVWATVLYAGAFITDQIDGYLARVLEQQTVLGEILDPLADKIIVLCVMIQLTYMHLIPPWVVMLLLTREIYINGLRAFAQSKGLSILPSTSGKIKVYFQAFGLGFLMMSPYHHLQTYPIHQIGMVLVFISLGLAILSAIDYTTKFIHHTQQKL